MSQTNEPIANEKDIRRSTSPHNYGLKLATRDMRHVGDERNEGAPHGIKPTSNLTQSVQHPISGIVT